MQISPLNFNGKYTSAFDERKEAKTRELQGSDILQAQEKLDNYIATTVEAKNNVRLTTVFSTLALFLGVAVKGRKVIDPVMNGLIAGGETISKKAAGLFGKLLKKSPVSIENVQKNIAKISDGLRDTKTKNISTKGLSEFINKVIPGKGEGVTSIIDKLNLNNKVSLARTALATAGAAYISDGFADKAENVQDNIAIKKARKPLEECGYSVVADTINAML